MCRHRRLCCLSERWQVGRDYMVFTVVWRPQFELRIGLVMSSNEHVYVDSDRLHCIDIRSTMVVSLSRKWPSIYWTGLLFWKDRAVTSDRGRRHIR